MTNPYKNHKNPQKAFWKKAVTEKGMFGLSQLYSKKFTISNEDRIATAGSCFAQHIGNRLQSSGFNYIDVEKSPSFLSQDQKFKNNYGIYSARYGNIYSVRQLLQLYERAFGAFTPVDEDWIKGSRFYDAFRPTIDPNGYETVQELQVNRKFHLQAVKELFETVDVFVFTLGLTEAWISKLDGAVYPMCPGTVAGTFSDEKYDFYNFTTQEIIDDMEMFMSHMKEHNSNIRFIFTVSPVPLVATATDDHVLVATTHSKSVLRAAAGELAKKHDCVDYFPSYELISSPVIRGTFFAPDMRKVETNGVDYVMKNFFIEHHPIVSDNRQYKKTKLSTDSEMHPDDIICDEILLEEYAK